MATKRQILILTTLHHTYRVTTRKAPATISREHVQTTWRERLHRGFFDRSRSLKRSRKQASSLSAGSLSECPGSMDSEGLLRITSHIFEGLSQTYGLREAGRVGYERYFERSLYRPFLREGRSRCRLSGRRPLVKPLAPSCGTPNAGAIRQDPSCTCGRGSKTCHQMLASYCRRAHYF